MLLDNIDPHMLEISLIATFGLFLLVGLIWLFFLLRSFKMMQNTVLQLLTVHTSTQTSITQLQTATQEDLRQLHAAHTTTQASIPQLQAATQEDIHQLRPSTFP